MVRRHQLLASSASLIAVGLASCAGNTGDPTDSTGQSTDTGTNTETTNEIEETTASGPTPYTVQIEPNDPYTFEEIPETYGVGTSPFIDMGMALGIHPTATTGLSHRVHDQRANGTE